MGITLGEADFAALISMVCPLKLSSKTVLRIY